MSTEIAIQQETAAADGIGGMAYALGAYAVGAGMLFWLLFAAGGLVPYGLGDYAAATVPGAIAVNAGLVFLFGLQHTIMARRSFKQWLTRYIPAHLERATFVLAAGLVMFPLIWFWQELPGQVWLVSNQAVALAIRAVYVAGIVYVLLTSLITNHFELFGLRQAWLNMKGRPYTPLEFKRVWFYRYSRHPMMLGLLLVFWFTPDMSFTRFCLAVLLTVYTFTGIRFEEHGLIQEFGEKYRQYRKEVGLFFTLDRK